MGGIGTVIYYEAKYLSDAGHEVKIVTLNPKREHTPNVELIRLVKPNEVNKLNCDIIHIHDGLQFLRALKQDMRAVATYHGYTPWHLRPTVRDMIFMPIYKRVYLRQLTRTAVKKIIAVSKYVSRELAHVNEKVSVIYNGVETRLFRPINDERIKELKEQMGEPALIYVGSFYRHKRVLDLVKAMPLVLREYSNCKLTLVGYGPEKPKIAKLSKKLGVQQQVKLKETVPNQELPLYYNAADICITASMWEGFGLTPLEAMACGKPVIGRNIPAIAEQAEKAGSILTFNRLEEVPNLMKDLLDNYMYFSRRALEYAKTLSWDSHIVELVKVYEKL